jgi:poly(beta-D-mannuronate) lyase
MSSLFELGPKGRLILQNIYIDAQGVKAKHFISTGESGSAEQYYLMVSNLSISGLDRTKGCEDFFFANKSRTADMIYISSTIFTQNNADIFVMNQEKDDKGYYNAEHIIMVNNGFNNNNGKLIDIYRGGNDESTMGPAFDFTGNNINNSSTTGDDPLILLTGVQQSALFNNKFENSNKGKVAIRYKDRVRAVHRYRKNELRNSGSVEKNEYFMDLDKTKN